MRDDGIDDGFDGTRDGRHGFLSWRSEHRLLSLVVCLLVVVLAAAWWQGGVSLVGAVAMAFFGSLALLFVVLLVVTLERGGSVGFESAWGGLGSGLGGWRLSAPLVYLLGAVVAGVLFAATVGLEMLPSGGEAGAPKAPPAAEGTPGESPGQNAAEGAPGDVTTGTRDTPRQAGDDTGGAAAGSGEEDGGAQGGGTEVEGAEDEAAEPATTTNGQR